MNSRPLVSLAIFAYNHSQFIEEAIESALAQSYFPLEVVISDDSSTDDTFDKINKTLAKYNGPHRIIINRNPVNLGIAGNINVVLEISHGDIICWAGGDDVSLPGKLEALVTPLVEDGTLVGTHSYVNEIDEEGYFIRLRRPSVPFLIYSPEQVIQGALDVVTQSHAFRRSVFLKFGNIGEFVTSEGAVMAFRESCIGKILLIEKPLTNYRIGVGTSTRLGKTVEELSVSEPIKYAGWWAFAYKQILEDVKLVKVSNKLQTLINRKAQLYEIIYRVNAVPMNLTALRVAFFSDGFFLVLKAFVRRNAPKFILRFIYRRLGWLT